jgi:ABC-type transporter Mla maintaining outer membrane lipid asymmetry ATPase subunit MlaF
MCYSRSSSHIPTSENGRAPGATHDLDSLVAICDRIAVLVDDRLIIGTHEELLQNPHPGTQAYFEGPRGRAARTAVA